MGSRAAALKAWETKRSRGYVNPSGWCHTEEAKQKSRAAHLGKKQSEESNAKRREATKLSWQDPEIRERRETGLAGVNRGNTHFLGHHHTEETKRRLRDANTGKVRSVETRAAISQSKMGTVSPQRGIPMTEENHKKVIEGINRSDVQQKIRDAYARWQNSEGYAADVLRIKEKWRQGLVSGEFVLKGRVGKGGWYQTPYNEKVYMRSSWERVFADFLTGWIGNRWRYEYKRFDLGSTTYAPDFYLLDFDQYIEIKGRTKYSKPEDGIAKVNSLKERYPDVKIKVLFDVLPKTLEKLKGELVLTRGK